MVTNYDFESPGMQVNAPGGITEASLQKFIDSSGGASQSVLDNYLSSNPNTKNLEVTPEQWLSGDIPEEISANFTSELIQEISYKLNRIELEKDAAEQRLKEAQTKAGKDKLTNQALKLENYIEQNYPDGLLIEETGEVLDLRYVAENLSVYSQIPGINGVLPEEFRKLANGLSDEYADYKKRVNENLKENKTTTITHGMTTQLPNEEFLPLKYVVSAKESLNSLLEEPGYFDRTKVAVSAKDIATLTEFTGVDFSKFVESDGRIPAYRINEYTDKVEGNGDYDNLAFSSQPLDGNRYVSKPFKLTKGSGKDATSLAISLYFPLGDGQNGTIGNTEINKVFQSTAAQAQEIILHPFQRSLESYTPPQAPNITIINTGNENSVKLKYTDLNTGAEQEINTTLSDATEIVEDALIMYNKKIQYLSNKPLYNSIIEYANEKNISFVDAEKLILKSKK
jgi:hypothetical protein